MEIHQPFNLDPTEYVSSINTLTGDVILAGGTGITLGTVGNTITINSTADLSVTLLDVSTNSITAPNSVYQMTAGIPVNYKSSDANSILYIDETTENVGFGGVTSPTARIDVKGEITTAVLGSEMITLAADRDFSSDTGNWTGTNWTIGGGVATHTAGANNFTLANSALSVAPVIGSTYLITFRINTTIAGTQGVSMQFGGVNVNYTGRSTALGAQNLSVVVTTISTAALVLVVGDGTWTGTLDNVSIKLISQTTPTEILRNSDGTIGSEFRSGGTGLNNTFLGYQTGFETTTGFQNTAIGYQSLYSNTGGIANTAIGRLSLYRNVTGNNNTAIGSNTLSLNTIGGDNVAIGVNTLSGNTIGVSNMAIGNNALQLNSEGYSNVAIGTTAFQNNTLGLYGIAIGTAAQNKNISGQQGVAIGGNALFNNTTGSFGVSIGTNSSFGNTTGSNNINFGFNSLRSNNTGSNNVSIGYQVGYNSGSTGALDNNIFIGYQAANNVTAGASENIVIGHDIDLQTAGGDGQLSIGNLIFGTGLSATGTTVSSGLVGIGVVAPSARLHVVQTTEQLRIGYDASNYYSTTVSSAGAITFDAVGASAGFTFNDTLTSTGIITAGTNLWMVPGASQSAIWSNPSINFTVGIAANSSGGGADSYIIFNAGGSIRLTASNSIYQLGGTTSSFPALKRSGTGLIVRLADDSADAPLQAGLLTSSDSVVAATSSYFYWNARSVLASPSNGVINLTTQNLGSFTRLNLGPATSSFPALKVNTTTLEVKLADDSAYTDLGLNKILTYGGITTSGWGVPAIYGSGRATAQTAANTSVSTYTVGAADGSFEVSANVLVTTSSAEAFTVTVDYTDESNTARTATFNFQIVVGTIGTAINFANGAVPYMGLPIHIRCKASTAITIKTVGVFTGATYNVEGIIKQIG